MVKDIVPDKKDVPPQEIEKSITDQLLNSIKMVLSYFKGVLGFQSDEPALETIQRQEEVSAFFANRLHGGLANKPAESRGFHNSVSPDRNRRPEATRRSVSSAQSLEPFSPNQLFEKVKSFYNSLDSYHDRGVIKYFGQDMQYFETYYSREHGFKMEETESGTKNRYILVGKERCIDSYMIRKSATWLLGECEEYGGAGQNKLAQHFIQKLLFGEMSLSKGISSVKETVLPGGKKAYLLTNGLPKKITELFWIDQETFHIVRYDQRWPNLPQDSAANFSIEYTLLESNTALKASNFVYEPPESVILGGSVRESRSKEARGIRRYEPDWKPILEAYRRGDHKSVADLLVRNIQAIEKEPELDERDEWELIRARHFLAYIYGWRLNRTDLALKEYRKISPDGGSNVSLFIGQLYEKEGDLEGALEYYRDFLDRVLASKESKGNAAFLFPVDELANLVRYRMDGINLRLKGKGRYRPLLEKISVIKQPHDLRVVQMTFMGIVPYMEYEKYLFMKQPGLSEELDPSKQMDYIKQSPGDIGSGIISYIFALDAAKEGIDDYAERLMEAYLSKYPESYHSLKIRYLLSEYYKKQGKPDKSKRLLREIKEIARKRNMEIVTAPDDRFSSPETTWALYKKALAKGDIDAALECFTPPSRGKYKKVFEKLGPENLKDMARRMRKIRKVKVNDNVAEYIISREEDGTMISYFIYFVKSGGEWKLDQF